MLLTWQHSVEKTHWEESYRIESGRLALVDAAVQGFGAGMEPPSGARFGNGWWHWQPEIAPQPELRLTMSAYSADYRICWQDRCESLASLIRITTENGALVHVRACMAPVR